MNRALTRLFDKDQGAERGVSIVEFALIVPLLLLLMMAIIELGAMFWVNLTMQHAVREGARYAVTGRIDLDPDADEDDVQLRPAAVAEKIRLSSLGFYDSVVSDLAVTDPDGNVLSGFGGSGETVVIRLQCAWPLLTPLVRPFFEDGTYNFTVSSTMRNENF